MSPPTPAWGPEVHRPLSPPLERSEGWDLRPRPPSTTLLPTCPVQVRLPSAPLRGSSCAGSARRRGRESAAPAPEFWIPGSPSPMPSASFYLFPGSRGRVPRSRPGAGASGSGKGRVCESWREAGRCPRPVWGLVGRLGRRLAPGACPLLAPHTVQFIHEPPGPALEGAVEKGLVRGTGEGQRPCWGEGACFVPNPP